MWDRSIISVAIVHIERFFIHAVVGKADDHLWDLKALYASSQRSLRPEIWQLLGKIHHSYPWAVNGDFNCTLQEGEQSSPGGVSDGLVNWVEKSQLIDISYVGQIFTWSHGNLLSSRKSAWLDRVLCDTDWRRTFLEAIVRHLPHSHSDHAPILLYLSGSQPSGLGRHPFKFQAKWLDHKEFAKVVADNWSSGEPLVHSLQKTAEALQQWNKSSFRNIFQRKRRLQR